MSLHGNESDRSRDRCQMEEDNNKGCTIDKYHTNKINNDDKRSSNKIIHKMKEINETGVGNDNNETTQSNQIITYRQRRNMRRRLKRKNGRGIKRLYKKENHPVHESDTNDTQQYSDEDKTWEDEIIISDNDENVTQKDVIRLVHYNANGIPADNAFLEWETILQSMKDVRADIFCLNETKLDTKNTHVQFQIRQLAKHHDQRMSIQMNSSLQTPKTRDYIYKPVCTMICTNGQWSGRNIYLKRDYTVDPLDRWTVKHMRGKDDTIISIFTVYRVCPEGDGINTAYIQQQNDLYDKHHRIMDPRDQIIKDLQKVLIRTIEENHKVILTADINEDA